MQGNSLQRTPERPGRGKRNLLEAASPFSLFAKELPPITPPRNQWDSSSTFPGCPGFTGLSPAMAGFTTPKLASETTPSGERCPQGKVMESALVKADQQQQSSRADPHISMFSPAEAAKEESHGQWRVGPVGAENQPSGGGFYSSIDRRDPVYGTPEDGARLQQLDDRAARAADHCPTDQPMKPQASAPQDVRQTRQSRAQTVKQPVAKAAMYGDEENTAATAVDSDARVDSQATQTSARGWETKLNPAGTGGRTWQYGQLKSPPESSSHHLPAAQLDSLQKMQSAAAAVASLTSPAMKAMMAAGGRIDQRLQSAAAFAALSAAAAATPVSRRLSTTSSGQADSVVPPTTPDDEAKTREAVSISDQPKRCNCKKSRCLKLYCDCFAAGQYCKHACSCQSCLNNADNKDIVVSMRDQVRQRNPQAFQEKIEKQANGQGSGVSGLHKRGCHCKKSHCKKKYCECFQAGVNCGVHCKCDECHNTVEDGLPPPPRPSGKPSASASASAPAAVANPPDRNKTSPGTPPAPGKETTSLDARRISSRSVKRKAWTSNAPATSEQPRRLNTPSTESSASQHRAPSTGVLSPPDMVWPANTLAQAHGHVLGSAVSNTGAVLSPPAPFTHSSVSRILGRAALEQAAQLQQLQSAAAGDAARLLSASLEPRREGAGPYCQCAPQLGASSQAEAQEGVQNKETGQCFATSMPASQMPGIQAGFPLPLPGLNTRARPDACMEQPLLVMGRVCDEAAARLDSSMEEKDVMHQPDRGAVSSAVFQEATSCFHAGTSSNTRLHTSALLKGAGEIVALPRTRHSEFSLADLAAAEEALCTATPWTEHHNNSLRATGRHGADTDVEQMLLGPEGVTQTSANAFLEQLQSIAFKTEDPMQTDQADMKKGMWMGQQAGRKKSSHGQKSSQVRKLTDVPRLSAGGRKDAPQRSASLPVPQASLAGSQSALTRSHSSAEDAGAEALSPTAAPSYGQGQMLRMGAGRTLISPS